jgi:hypothetical protein
MSASCAQFGVADNSEDELNDLSSSIQSVGSSTGVDPRFILAIVLQESNGCVRAPTTNGGVVNPGLMQSHDGAGTCNDATVSNPCPASEITQMIQDGTAGTSSGDGLAQCITASGATDVSMYYKAARIYNSGSVAAGGNLGAGIATHCYASDVANRLTGWFSGPSSCIPATIGDLTGAASGGSAATAAAPEPTTPAPAPASSGGVFAAIPTPAVQPTPTPDAPAASTVTVVPIPSSTAASPPPAATSSSPTPATAPSSSAPVYFGVISSCQEYYTVQPGDYCILVEGKFGISMSQLQTWNSGLETDCSNLWLGYQYCVQA